LADLIECDWHTPARKKKHQKCNREKTAKNNKNREKTNAQKKFEYK
jgi:hypothetical protein